jgi:8-oxo-dGTP diphosphatase
VNGQPLHVAVGFVTDHQGRWLLTQRAKHVHQGGLWEFPGGKLEPGETAYAALLRELREEVAIEVTAAEPLIQVRHDYPDLSVLLDVWRVSAFNGEAAAQEGQALHWVAPQDLADFPLPAANAAIVKAARLPGVYPVLEGDSAEMVWQRLLAIRAAGLHFAQFRAKGVAAQQRLRLWQHVSQYCAEHGIRLLLNADVHLPLQPGQGVHLSSRALAVCARRPQGVAWVGASCHDLQELQRAEALDLDFAVLAPVLPTATHPDAPALGWQTVQDWLRQVNLPVYVMGGLQLDDRARALAFGAQGIAGIRAFGA